MKILVTGGAGYIGSFMVKRLVIEHEVMVVDNFERGNKNSIDVEAQVISGNILDKSFVESVFNSHHFDAVFHFAGYISMSESMKNPSSYFENNVFGALHILEAMKKKKVDNFIFSSTAGVYGNPTNIPISEDHPKNPTNPYGESKLIVEQILKWYQKIFNISFVSLRYFNACGGALDGTLGENHEQETHIIPLAIKAILTDSEFNLYGTDYQTKDGTAVRDYIHVIDLVQAHVLSLNKLLNTKGGFFYNVGTGIGYTNKEVIAVIEKVTNKKVKVSQKPRRIGDTENLIADPELIKKDLGFLPKYSDLETIIKTAWEWHSKDSKLKT